MIKKIAAIALAIVILAMTFTGCIGISNSSSGSTTLNQVKLIIDYNGTWSGSMGTITKSTDINGTGRQEFTISQGNDTIFIVHALAQKADASNGTLTIMIQDMNGTMIRNGSSSAPYGVTSEWVLISYIVTPSGM